MRTAHPTEGSAVEALLDQAVDHAGVGQRRGVTHVLQLVAGDLAQDAPHDLARAGLGQARRPLDQLRLGEAADLLADQGQQVLLQLVGRFLACLLYTSRCV